jgi:hypothetical protein
MAGSASNYLENKLIDHSLGTTTFTKPTSVYLALYTVSPSDSSSGTEATGGSYVRKVITFSASSSGSTVNNTSITFSTMPTANIVAIGIIDAITSGNLLYWANLASNRALIAGDSIVFPSGSVVVSLD